MRMDFSIVDLLNYLQRILTALRKQLPYCGLVLSFGLELVLGQLNINCMNSITEQFRKSLQERTNQGYQTTPQGKSSEQVFMQHFQSINQNNFSSSKPQLQGLFSIKLQQYAALPSLITRIVADEEDNITGIHELRLTEHPTIVNLRSTAIDKIREIQAFFQRQYKGEDRSKDILLDIEKYSGVVLALGKATTEPIERAEMPVETKREAQTGTQDTGNKNTGKMRRVDIILIDILREKKRKTLTSDYYSAMEMKLMELLEHILEGEENYLGMDFPTKMKEIVRNIDSFKGKQVDGESKINLLKIFFEEFKNLKQEKTVRPKEVRPTAKTPINNDIKRKVRKTASVKHEQDDEWIGELR